MDGSAFANEIERVFHLYRPEFSYSQLNLLDSHDMPRFLSCVSGDKTSLKLALLFILTYPGAPCIYYGDEIGVDGRHDPECRKSFPWDENKWDADLLAYTKMCAKLRKDHVALRRGSFRSVHTEGQVYVFERAFEGEQMLVAFNAGDEAAQVEVQVEAGTYVSIFGQAKVASKDGKVQLKLEARSSVVIKRQP
jgi:neopullulanase